MKLALKKGFTLIELLVVIAVIGILAAVVLASLNSARVKGRDAARISTVKTIKTALELYYDQNGIYPLHSGGVNNSGYPITTIQPVMSQFVGAIDDPNGYIQYVRSGNALGYGLRVYREQTKDYCLTYFGLGTTIYWWGNGGTGLKLPECNF